MLASTDYDWKQAEEKTLKECLECNNKQIKVDCKYTLRKLALVIYDDF